MSHTSPILFILESELAKKKPIDASLLLTEGKHLILPQLLVLLYDDINPSIEIPVA